MEWKDLLSLERQVEKESEPTEFAKYPIEQFEKDYFAIVSSSAFRRLQDKTQVFPLDKSDFVRTRLTHSIEVSTIAKQLGMMVTENTTDYLQEDFRNNPNYAKQIPMVLSCAGLLHDIGNPPFGHFGEVVIGDWFRNELEKDEFAYKGKPIRELLTVQMKNDLENFEGNAQALRILSKAKRNSEGYDINLSYGVLNTLIKYPTSSVDFSKDNSDVKKHKLGYFYAEKEIIQTICEKTGTNGNTGYLRHPLVYLMEAADDIAYTTADLEDALKKGLFTLDEFMKYFKDEIQKIKNRYHKKYVEEVFKNLEMKVDSSDRDSEKDLVAFQKWMVYVRGWLMYVVAYRFSNSYDSIMKGTYAADMFKDTNYQELIVILKSAMRRFVYNNTEILKLELAAKKIIGSLLNDFIHAVLYWEDEMEDKMTLADKKYINVISANYKENYRHERTGDDVENLYLRFLMVTDFISGMTDSYAKTLYQELNGID